jgi:hypothetical protein
MSDFEGVESYEPKGKGPYESRAEEVIDWYQHYMAVSIEELALEYMAKVGSEESDPSKAMEMAVEERSGEAGRYLVEGGED